MKYIIAMAAALAVAIPAAAQFTQVHTQQQERARAACPGLVSRHEAAVAGGLSSYYAPAADCACLATAITDEGWDDVDMAFTGEFMTEADAYLVADTISTAGSVDDAVTLIYDSISTPGTSVLANCFGK